MVEAEKTEEDLSEDEKKQLNTLRKQGYLIGVCCLETGQVHLLNLSFSRSPSKMFL